mgnify:CR=1 FL=1|jgi:hypothetical protein
MDIHCRFCGEPWDHDCLHEFGDYEKRGKLFAQFGCTALQDEATPTDKCSNGVVDERAAAYAIAAQLFSDYPEDWVEL